MNYPKAVRFALSFSARVEPFVCTWLSKSSGIRMTNLESRWKVTNAPIIDHDGLVKLIINVVEDVTGPVQIP